jgi:RHS repeat-associated protein
VIQSYTYSSFGKLESQLDPNFIQPYTFTAREFDQEAAVYYYRARNYNHLTGRFLQEDPITRTTILVFTQLARRFANIPPQILQGLSGFPDRSLQYEYVRNNPVNLTDPFGLVELRDPRVKGIIGALVDLLLDEVEGQLCQGTTPKAIIDLVQGIVGAESAAYLTIGAIGLGLSAVTIAATPVAVVGGLVGAGGLAAIAGNEAARSAANFQEAFDYFTDQRQ